MAASRKPKYRFEVPGTEQYLTERADGTFGITPKACDSIGLDTSGQAQTFSSTRLHSTPHEIVRVHA